MTYNDNHTSSCCAPDGTCSNTDTKRPEKEKKPAKPELYFLTKLKKDQLIKIESILKEAQTQDSASKNSSFIKESLTPELPKYFLKKLLNAFEKKSAEPLLTKVTELVKQPS